jgi:hypothetical protein
MMPTNIINGNVDDIISQTKLIMVLTSSGTEVTTGQAILPSALAAVEANILYILPVDINGDSLV